MTKLKVGIIGTGGISELHMASYLKKEEAEVIAVCDLNASRAGQMANKYGIAHVYASHQDLVANPDIDAVSICTWNNSHARIAIDALDAGKQVLVEKPLCRTVEEAYQIEEAVRRSGKLLQVGFVRRYAENTVLVKEFIDAGDIGEIYYAKASCLRRLANPGGWFADIERSGGGPLIDLGVHMIDLCWYLMGRPKVKSISSNTYHKLGNRSHIQNLSSYKAADYEAGGQNTVEDLANALIRFENGASLMVDVSFSLHLTKKSENAVKLYGSKGGVEVEPELQLTTERHNTILNLTPQVNNLGYDAKKGFDRQIAHFVDSCLGRKLTLSPVEDGVEMMKILCGIYESAEKGKEIYFA